MSMKRGAKGAALGVVTRRRSVNPDPLSAAALRLMKIGLEPGLPSGYLGGARGAACISVDFDVTSGERYPWNHEGTSALLGLSEDYGIPFTWAICGKTAEEDPKAYESILSSSVKQDVGVHTYSHVYADECTEEEYERDIAKCISVLRLSSPPRSFVFPKNREGHFGLLRRLGFTSFRGKRRVVGAPADVQGLWNLRPVYYLDGKSLEAAGLIRSFVDACIARSAVFHLWTHPWSLAVEGKVDRMVAEVMRPVFAYLEEMRTQGSLCVGTMDELSSFMSSTRS
jgi:hypothetical protein